MIVTLQAGRDTSVVVLVCADGRHPKSTPCPAISALSTFALPDPPDRILPGHKMAMENTFDNTAVETIDLLEARLRRIEFAVCGSDDQVPAANENGSASQRLADLEHALHQLASRSRMIQDLLRLRGYISYLLRGFC